MCRAGHDFVCKLRNDHMTILLLMYSNVNLRRMDDHDVKMQLRDHISSACHQELEGQVCCAVSLFFVFVFVAARCRGVWPGLARVRARVTWNFIERGNAAVAQPPHCPAYLAAVVNGGIGDPNVVVVPPQVTRRNRQ